MVVDGVLCEGSSLKMKRIVWLLEFCKVIGCW